MQSLEIMKAPDKKKSQEFARYVCKDYNNKHNENHPSQAVPGDWEVTYLITEKKLFCPENFIENTYKKLEVVFSGQLRPSEEIEITENCIKKKGTEKSTLEYNIQKNNIDSFILIPFSETYISKTETNPKNLEEYFTIPQKNLKDIIQNYCLASGDIGSHVVNIIKNTKNSNQFEENLKKILEKYEIKITEKSNFLYGSSNLSINKKALESQIITRRISLPTIEIIGKNGKGKKAKIDFIFPIYNESADQVGLYQKSVIGTGL